MHVSRQTDVLLPCSANTDRTIRDCLFPYLDYDSVPKDNLDSSSIHDEILSQALS
jgi:hypothetical protein